MDLNFENDNLDECYVGIRAPKVVTKMSNKCNQCEYASSLAGNLKTHLKTHAGEKSNKCNQYDFACSLASNLRTHLKMWPKSDLNYSSHR